jgi:hypothetical protein
MREQNSCSLVLTDIHKAYQSNLIKRVNCSHLSLCVYGLLSTLYLIDLHFGRKEEVFFTLDSPNKEIRVLREMSPFFSIKGDEEAFDEEATLEKIKTGWPSIPLQRIVEAFGCDNERTDFQ